ncbi:mitochondrial splicing system protein [Rhodotorula kratochvilovae]
MLRSLIPPLRSRCTCSPAGPLPPARRALSTPAAPPPSFRLPTIFAPATGQGKSAISILRISGPDALDVWRKMTRPPRGRGRTQPGSEGRDPPERRAVLRRIVGLDGEVLDEGVVLYFPPHSALTAQPTLELHLHGSPALMSLLLRTLPSLGEGFRLADPGEFTRLAFEAGKMDLTEVEGIRDLVEAETEAQRKLAARQASGHMRAAYDAMRAEAIEAMALVEALIDFGEDEGISEGVFEQARKKAEKLSARIRKYLADGRRGEILRQGIHLAIVGPPNAGKSSLLNWLAQREAAIVTAVPGTTRDVVELALDFHGFPVHVADTAGLRKTVDEVEAIGIERAVARAETADIKLCVLPLDELFPPASSSTTSAAGPPPPLHIDPLTLSLLEAHTLILLNKLDARASPPSPAQLAALEAYLAQEGRTWAGRGTERPFEVVSVRDGRGLAELAERLKGEVKRRFDLPEAEEEMPIVTQERHRRHLEETLSFLTTFLDLPASELVDAGEELRYAVRSLGQITGQVDTEEVLGEIFRGFCIGK